MKTVKIWMPCCSFEIIPENELSAIYDYSIEVDDEIFRNWQNTMKIYHLVQEEIRSTIKSGIHKSRTIYIFDPSEAKEKGESCE